MTEFSQVPAVHAYIVCQSEKLIVKKEKWFPNLRKFKRETYIFAQTEGHLIHIQLWEQGYIKGVPFFLRKRVLHLIQHF